jgi:ribosomal protein S18 acetylase RimI-like enzyme
MPKVLSDEIQIRSARLGDEAEIANVHLNSWREAYRGLLPQTFLDSLPLTFKRRMNWWHKITNEPQDYVLRVAEAKSGIVGFACFGLSRDSSMEKFAEVQAIYLLEKYKGKGIGFILLSSGFGEMIERGFTSAYCWVLADNPTIKFYERCGAVFSGQTKNDEIGGKKVTELAYTWSDLKVASSRS